MRVEGRRAKRLDHAVTSGVCLELRPREPVGPCKVCKVMFMHCGMIVLSGYIVVSSARCELPDGKSKIHPLSFSLPPAPAETWTLSAIQSEGVSVVLPHYTGVSGVQSPVGRQSVSRPPRRGALRTYRRMPASRPAALLRQWSRRVRYRRSKQTFPSTPPRRFRVAREQTCPSLGPARRPVPLARPWTGPPAWRSDTGPVARSPPSSGHRW